MKTAWLGSLALLLLSPVAARADGAPAAVAADESATLIPLPAPEIGGSPIETRPYYLNASAAAGGRTDGTLRARAQGAVGLTLFLKTDGGPSLEPFKWSNNIRGEVGPSILVGAQARVDGVPGGDGAGVRNLEVRTGGPNIYQVFGNNAEVKHDEKGRVVDYRAPSLTYTFKGGGLSYHHRDQKDLNATVSGFKATLLEGSGHVAFKVGLPIDVCAQAGISFLTGKGEIPGESKSGILRMVDGVACAGVQLGPVGRLGYEFRYSQAYNGADKGGDLTDISHAVSLRKIGHSPIGIAASHEETSAGSAQESVKTNWVQIQGEF